MLRKTIYRVPKQIRTQGASAEHLSQIDMIQHLRVIVQANSNNHQTIKIDLNPTNTQKARTCSPLVRSHTYKYYASGYDFVIKHIEEA